MDISWNHTFPINYMKTSNYLLKLKSKRGEQQSSLALIIMDLGDCSFGCILLLLINMAFEVWPWDSNDDNSGNDNHSNNYIMNNNDKVRDKVRRKFNNNNKVNGQTCQQRKRQWQMATMTMITTILSFAFTMCKDHWSKVMVYRIAQESVMLLIVISELILWFHLAVGTNSKQKTLHEK